MSQIEILLYLWQKTNSFQYNNWQTVGAVAETEMLKQRDKKGRLEWKVHAGFGDYRENDVSNIVNFSKICSVFLYAWFTTAL